MKKKLLLVLSVLALLVCALAISVSAAEINGVYYDLDAKNGVATVSKENKTSTFEIAEIPSTFTYEGVEYKVTKIENDAFAGNKTVKEIRILSEYITKIPYGMIASTHGGALEKIYINFSQITSYDSAALNPSTQTNGNSPVANSFYYYDAKAFVETGADVLITDPDFSNCTSIGTAAFQGANFKKLTIPAAVYLNNQIFRKSTIEELIIEGENRTAIDHYVFNDCNQLKKITIKSRNLKTISNDVFSGDTEVQEIYIDMSKCESVSGAAFQFSSRYDGGNNTVQWYNLEGEKIVDLSSMKNFQSKSFCSSNLGSAKIVWPRAIETLSSQVFRKCNIVNQPILINAAAGKTLDMEFWAFEGNSPTVLICNEGVTSIGARFSGITAVFLAPSIKITDKENSFRDGSTLYCKGLTDDSRVPSTSHCTIIDISNGAIANYGVCGVIATVETTDGNVTVGEVSHTTFDEINNSLCPIGKVNETKCKYCTYIKYTIDGEEASAKSHEYVLVGSITYTNFYEMGFKTNRCECGAEKTNETATENAIFAYKGISISQFPDKNGNYSITQGYFVDATAYKNYIDAGKTLSFGVVASAKSVTGACPLTIVDGEVKAINEAKTIFAPQYTIPHNYIDVKVTGISVSLNGNELIMCLFAFDGESIYYMNEAAQGEEASSVVINVGA